MKYLQAFSISWDYPFKTGCPEYVLLNILFKAFLKPIKMAILYTKFQLQVNGLRFVWIDIGVLFISLDR
jgi:hypothetical protein